jgi:hypothetical protein
MKTTLYSVDPSTTVGEALSLMAQNRIGSALIMEGGKLVGIFTERDTVRAISQSYDARPRIPPPACGGGKRGHRDDLDEGPGGQRATGRLAFFLAPLPSPLP